MTGFGRKETTHDGGTIGVEIRAVNHRFLDIQCRLPRGMAAIEEACKQAIQQQCKRGRIDVSVSLGGERASTKQVAIDRPLAKQYLAALKTLKKELKLAGTPDLTMVAGFRDVLSLTDTPAQEQNLEKLISKTITAALKELVRMRELEGEALTAAMLQHLGQLEQAQAEIAARAPHVTQEALARMKARIHTLLQPHSIDEARLYQELAILSDRSDVSEELARLSSHCSQFRQALTRDDQVGKTLDFLIQEMGREVNTIGSKANDAAITTAVVQMKTELEKIREQVQNIE
ncbi:MAG: YicC/YloC family endoribonuclease [Nitrospiraceae bacterium]